MAKTIENSFVDIFEPRRKERSNMSWVTRSWNPVVAFKRYQRINPEDLKFNVLKSDRLQIILEKIAEEQNVPVNLLKKNIKPLLDEIGFTKDMNVIRALCILLIKILKRVCSKIYLNVHTIENIKRNMGQNPVIFLPSHRSYADFILMSYICFTSNIEIPAIAAGMDFHGMWGMGSILRDTGAFFMRRQFANDRVYSNVFAEYIRELVINGDIALEFFIEGTRSRSLKSLPPKFGLLSMVLKPFFFGEVPDITIIPISISYDRVMEETLFSTELLGVPKPKESTTGLFKAINIVNEKFGNIYFNFAEPISVKEYFGNNISRSTHALGALNTQSLNDYETEHIARLAYDIVKTQQNHCIINAFNIIALLISNNLISGNDTYEIQQLKTDMLWLKNIFEQFGAIVCVNDTDADLANALEVHRNLITCSESDQLIRIVKNILLFGKYDKKRLKGHELDLQTMNTALPLVKLQIYTNPTLHFIVGGAIMAMIFEKYHQNESSRGLKKDEIWTHFQWLRRLFAFEFVIYKDRERLEFEDSLRNLEQLNVIKNINQEKSSSVFVIGVNDKLHTLLCNCLTPFILTYDIVCEVLLQVKVKNSEKEILCFVQRRVEEIFNEAVTKYVHPYALSLDTIVTALQSLSALNGVKKFRQDNIVYYSPISDVLQGVRDSLGGFLFATNTRENQLELQVKENRQTVISIFDRITYTFNICVDVIGLICIIFFLSVIYLLKFVGHLCF